MGNMRLHREVRIELITLWVLIKSAVSGGASISERVAVSLAARAGGWF